MKKYIYSAAALMTFSMLTLTSCQNEMEQLGNPVGQQTLLRVTTNRGDAETRTSLEHDGGDLTCNWSVGDQLMVVGQSTGKKIGVVTLVSGEDTPNAVFEGNVDLSDNTNVSLVYLGTAENAENYSESLNYLSLNLSEQNGTLASLSDKDVLTSSTFVVDNTYSSKEVEIADVTMTRQLAFGRFTLDFGEENVTLEAGDVITITGEGLRSEGKVNFRNGGSVPDNSASYTGSTSITITKTEGGNDFYVTMLPYGNVTPTFTVEKDGYIYTATLGAHNWVSGEFVRKNDVGEAVDVTEWTKKVTKLDDTIFGVKWVDYNTQSIISGYRDNYVILSYIPYMNLQSQGYPDNYVIDYEENPEIIYYQWDREFGFMGIDDSEGNRYPRYGSLEDYWAPIPGDGYEMGWQYNPAQYWYSNSQCTNNNLGSNYYILYYPTAAKTKDWLSDHSATKWESKMTKYNMSAIPTGFMLPEKSTWEKLLINSDGSTVKRDIIYNHISDDVPYALYPLKVVNESDGTTVVWSIETRFDGSNKQIWILDIRRLLGTYSLSDLAKDENILMSCDNPLRLGAYGYLSSQGVCQKYGTEGYYWTANSSTTSGEAYAFHFVVDVTNGTLKTEIVSKPRKEVYSVRCAYNN